MKIRTDFVTNSSSSSFVFDQKYSLEQANKIINDCAKTALEIRKLYKNKSFYGMAKEIEKRHDKPTDNQKKLLLDYYIKPITEKLFQKWGITVSNRTYNDILGNITYDVVHNLDSELSKSTKNGWIKQFAEAKVDENGVLYKDRTKTVRGDKEYEYPVFKLFQMKDLGEEPKDIDERKAWFDANWEIYEVFGWYTNVFEDEKPLEFNNNIAMYSSDGDGAGLENGVFTSLLIAFCVDWCGHMG